MNPFAFSNLLGGISSLSFGFFVLFKSSNKPLARTWFLFSMSVAIYGFSAVFATTTTNPVTSLVWWKVMYGFGVIWIAPLYYHFVTTFLEIRNDRYVRIHHVLGGLFSASLLTPYFFTHVEWYFDAYFEGMAGPAMKVYVVWWFWLVIYSYIRLLHAYRTVTDEKKNKIRYFFLATTIGFTGGSFSYLPAFGINLFPWGNFAVFLYPIIMAYAILRHQLMDITVVIRKTMVYSLLSAGLGAIYAGSITLLAYFVGTQDQLPFVITGTNALSRINLHWFITQVRISFSYACIVTSIASITLGLFVYWKGQRKFLNALWLGTCLAISVWSFGLGLEVQSTDFVCAYFWARWFTHLGAILIPINFLHFVTALLKTRATKTLFIGYTCGAIFCYLAITGNLVSVFQITPADQMFPFRYYVKPLPLYNLFLIYFFVLVVIAHGLLAYHSYIAKDKVRKQLVAILIGTGLGFIGGSTTFLPAFHIHIFPYGAYIVPVYVLAISYAIFKHQLMDISVVIRKTLLYSLVTAALIAVYVGTITLLAQVWGDRHGPASAASSAVAAIFITILFNPLRVRVQRFVDRYFLREAVDETVLREITGAFVHEIKTPLANIALPAELTFMDMEDLQSGKASPDELIPKIKKRMKYIMDQALLAGTKVEAVREATVADDIAKSTADLSQVLENSLRQMDEHLDKSRVKVYKDIPTSLREISGSPRQLEVVFGNLIKNAAEALSEGEEPRSLEIIVKVREQQIQVEVKDNGPGIKETDLPIVFFSHFSTKGAKGAGMGLFLCKQIVDAHHGTIEVTSQLRKGTTFTVKLPA